MKLLSLALVFLMYSCLTHGLLWARSNDFDAVSSDSLKHEVRQLLTHYESLINQLTESNSETVGRQILLEVFANPKVQVFSELGQDMQNAQISIEQYLTDLVKTFPLGHHYSYEWKTLKLKRPEHVFGDQYQVLAEVARIQGESDLKIVRDRDRCIFQITYLLIDDKPEELRIGGISLSKANDNFLRLDLCLGSNRFTNETIRNDSRLNLLWDPGYLVAARFEHFLTPLIGVSTGISWSLLSGSLSLDHFDAYQGFDPHISDVTFKTSFYNAEIPFSMILRTNTDNRLNGSFRLGVTGGFNYYETWNSVGISSPSERTLTHVISDQDWIQKLNHFYLNLSAEFSIDWQLSNWLTVSVTGGYRQGLSPLDSYRVQNYSTLKYTGQIHPLWGEAGSVTLMQSMTGGIGWSYKLNR